MLTFKHRSGSFNMQDMPLIMGILNVTPDSFSDGGLYLDKQTAINRAKQMIEQGADIIDVGAMSTRPGSMPISADEEIERLKDVLPEICKLGKPVSIDTVNHETAAFALDCGVSIINDVNGEFTYKIAKLVKKYSAGWIMTHTKQCVLEEPFDDAVIKIQRFFNMFAKMCDGFGIDLKNLCFDPGFGFGQTIEDDILVFRHFEHLKNSKVAMMVGLSRKRFIGAMTNTSEIAERDLETSVANFHVLANGANIIRVHNVEAAKKTVDVYNRIYVAKY